MVLAAVGTRCRFGPASGGWLYCYHYVHFLQRATQKKRGVGWSASCPSGLPGLAHPWYDLLATCIKAWLCHYLSQSWGVTGATVGMETESWILVRSAGNSKQMLLSLLPVSVSIRDVNIFKCSACYTLGWCWDFAALGKMGTNPPTLSQLTGPPIIESLKHFTALGNHLLFL